MTDIHPTAVISHGARFYTTSLKVGPYSRIDDGCVFTGDVEIGAYTHISCYVLLFGKSGIKVGSYVGLCAFTAIYSESDDFTGVGLMNPCVPEWTRNVDRGRVVVGDNVILGARTTVLPGITIHNGAATGAHSLVREDLPGDSVYMGVPAEFVKKRKTEHWERRTEFEQCVVTHTKL